MMKNVMKVILCLMYPISLLIYIVLGFTHKALISINPKGNKRLKKFINAFFTSSGGAKKSFAIILFPAILIVFGIPSIIYFNSISAEANEITVNAESGNKVTDTETHVSINTEDDKEIEEVSPPDTINQIIIPNDYRGEFISTLIDSSVQVGIDYGIYPSVIMAQAILESDWGRSGLTKSANNYFGVKARKGQASVNLMTVEYYDGKTPEQIYDDFAKYSSPYESLESNATLIRNGISGDPTFYSGAWRENAKSYKDAANSLTNKYATDPNYGTKLINIIHEYGLNYAD